MSHARRLGFVLYRRCLTASSSINICREICSQLNITDHELAKLFAGRLFLTYDDLEKISLVLDTSTECILEESDVASLDNKGEFSNPINKEIVLDIIDGYIDAKEALVNL